LGPTFQWERISNFGCPFQLRLTPEHVEKFGDIRGWCSKKDETICIDHDKNNVEIQRVNARGNHITDAAAAAADDDDDDVKLKQFECTVEPQHISHGQSSSGQFMLDTSSERLWRLVCHRLVFHQHLAVKVFEPSMTFQQHFYVTDAKCLCKCCDSVTSSSSAEA